MERLGLSVRPARKGSSGWRFETATRDFARLVETVERAAGGVDVSSASPRDSPRRRTARQGAELASVHARLGGAPGMVMVDENGEFDVVERGRARRARPPGLRPRRRANAQLRRQRPRHAQLDLRLPRRRHPQHPRVRARLPGRDDDRARAELPLDERDPRGGERRHRHNRERKPKNLWSELGEGDPVRVDRGRGRARRGALRRGRDRAARRGGLLAAARSRSSTA